MNNLASIICGLVGFVLCATLKENGVELYISFMTTYLVARKVFDN